MQSINPFGAGAAPKSLSSASAESSIGDQYYYQSSSDWKQIALIGGLILIPLIAVLAFLKGGR